MIEPSAHTITQLIASGEGQALEFKDERVKPSDLAETLVAFANTDGGTVLVGVADDLFLTGVTDPKDATDNVLIAASRECSDPPVRLISVTRMTLKADKVVIVARVSQSQTAIHSTHGRFFKREGSRNVALTADDLRQLIVDRGGVDSLPLVSRRGRRRASTAPAYELLRHEITVTLLDSEGREAVVERRQRLRFLQDNMVALYDRAWGDGQLFADYRVTPGRVADRFRAGSRYHTLISLRDTKHRGDVVTYRIRRRIVGGFTRQDEWYEVDVDHPTHYLELDIIFPGERPCLEAQLVEASSNRQTPLDSRYFHRKRDGRQVLTWSVKNPLLGERYAIHWHW